MVERHLIPGEPPIAIDVRRVPRARAFRLSVAPHAGAARLSIPKGANLSQALRWAAEKRGWIAAQLARQAPANPVRPGMTVRYRGQDLALEWRAEGPRACRIEDGRIFAGGPEAGLAARLERWLKAEARTLLARESREMAGRLQGGVPLGRVGVGDPATRWGSCSARGDIRYSWRLILAPDWVRRSIVAHEVAHLLHRHHAPSFYALAADLMGDETRKARSWLRANGPALHAFGRGPGLALD